jgi:hypothetical protein
MQEASVTINTVFSCIYSDVLTELLVLVTPQVKRNCPRLNAGQTLN